MHVVLIWLALSVPLSVVVGKALARAARTDGEQR